MKGDLGGAAAGLAQDELVEAGGTVLHALHGGGFPGHAGWVRTGRKAPDRPAVGGGGRRIGIGGCGDRGCGRKWREHCCETGRRRRGIF
jgi:hypothetical protein